MSRPPINTARELWRRAKAHDFYFEMSDDYRVYCAGRDDADEIIRAAQRLGQTELLHQIWAWHRRKGPLPDEPEEV